MLRARGLIRFLRTRGLGSRVPGLGFRVQGLGFWGFEGVGVWGLQVLRGCGGFSGVVQGCSLAP